MVDVFFGRAGLKLVDDAECEERDRQVFMLAMALIVDVWRREINDTLSMHVGFFTERYRNHFIANLEELGVWQTCGRFEPMSDLVKICIGVDDVPLLRPSTKS